MMELSHFHAFPALFFAFALFFLIFPMMMALSWIAFSRGRMPTGPMGFTPWAFMRWPLSMAADWSGEAPALKSTGSRAFDAYKTETLARLDEEEMAFAAFRERLRAARDRAEFDNYLNNRANTDAPTRKSNRTETNT